MKSCIVDAIAEKFGGQTRLAEAIDLDQSTVNKWKTRSDNVIPARQQKKILEAARERGIKIEPADFFRVHEESNTTVSLEP